VALIVAALVTAAVTPLIARLAVRLGVVDRPGALKVHARPVPYLGGVAVLLGLSAPVLLTRPALLAPLALALALGLADDVADLPPRLRIAGEVVVGVAGVLALPDPPGLGWSVVLVAVTVGLLNAVNLLDGLDGLAASVAALAGLGFAAVLDADAEVALALSGALLGFLLWNRPPARIYLGDAGSYLVGTNLALLLALVVTGADDLAPSAGALLFVAVPVADTTVAIVRRARAHRPLLLGDRGHIYDQLIDRGWTARGATAACIAAQAALVALGIGIASLGAGAAVALTAVTIVITGSAVLWAFTSPEAWAT